MPRMVIVPDSLRDAINANLDAALADWPEAEKDREHLFGQLLDAFDSTGSIPDFRITGPYQMEVE